MRRPTPLVEFFEGVSPPTEPILEKPQEQHTDCLIFFASFCILRLFRHPEQWLAVSPELRQLPYREF